MWGATGRASAVFPGADAISIHAPRVGCDVPAICLAVSKLNFNPRTPCGVRRTTRIVITTITRFQSTHPVWGATLGLSIIGSIFGISIHAPRVGCDSKLGIWYDQLKISIHAPRVGCDDRRKYRHFRNCYFNPRTPCGVRLVLVNGDSATVKFQSTHPVWGATGLGGPAGDGVMDFNPRTPCGVRQRIMRP